MNATTRSAWAKVNRDYNKAITPLADAMDFLARTERDPDDYDTFDAYELVRKAAERVNDAYTAARKALGVAVYTPYGRPAARRY